MAAERVMTLLRDAAVFEAEAEVSEGLAHRALAQHIARQEQAGFTARGREARSLGLGAWLGGLSFGTLAGAAAALVLCVHLGWVHLAHETPPPSARPSSPPVAAALPATGVKAAPAVAPAAPVRRAAEPVAAHPAPSAPLIPVAMPAEHSTERLQLAVSMRPARISVPARVTHAALSQPRVNRTAPARAAVTHASPSPAAKRAADEEPESARWQTETVDENAYQLVTTGYVATPSEDSRDSDAVVVPVQVRMGLEPTGNEADATRRLPELTPVNYHP